MLGALGRFVVAGGRKLCVVRLPGGDVCMSDLELMVVDE